MEPHLPPAYPLAWPEGWERTEVFWRSRSRYRVTATRAFEFIAKEMAAWSMVLRRAASGAAHDGKQYVVSTNMPARVTGRGPVTSGREPGDPGVAVWWLRREGGETTLQVVACDTWKTVGENMRACGVVIESLRKIERAQATEVLKRAGWATRAGLPALRDSAIEKPKPKVVRKRSKARPWYETRLELVSPYTKAEVQRAYKRAVAREHPDRGGDAEKFLELEKARDAALHTAADADSSWQEVAL